jgi:hypothetical protein
MKVCERHRKTSGYSKRNLQIVSPDECEFCKMENYFNDPKNPARKTEHECIEMFRERLRRGSSSGTSNQQH